jgi:hypothetical protein
MGIDVKERRRPCLDGNIIIILKVTHRGASGLEAPFKRSRHRLGKPERSIHHSIKVELRKQGYKTEFYMVNN